MYWFLFIFKHLVIMLTTTQPCNPQYTSVFFLNTLYGFHSVSTLICACSASHNLVWVRQQMSCMSTLHCFRLLKSFTLAAIRDCRWWLHAGKMLLEGKLGVLRDILSFPPVRLLRDLFILFPSTTKNSLMHHFFTLQVS